MTSINLISNFGEDAKLENVRVFNHTVAWFLRKALEKKGIEVRFVKEHDLLVNSPPNADHTLVISAIGMHYWAGTHRFVRGKTPTVRSKIRKATKGKVAVYIDADYGTWINQFDYLFSVIQPRSGNPKCVYAGWGADPEYCYPEQEERAVFLDTFNLKKPRGRKSIYEIYEEVLPTLKIKVYRPKPFYHKDKRLNWPNFQKIMRKCHYYCCTQLGDSGLTRIEAATCGALLVVPNLLYKPRTMASLEHRRWTTKQGLIKILKTETDPEAIREKALKHSWDKVATRILNRLNK